MAEPTYPDIEQMSFEQAMEELEKVVTQLDRGDVSLDESISLYERGAHLRKRCEDTLKRAEERVASITLDASGTPTGSEPLEKAGDDLGF